MNINGTSSLYGYNPASTYKTSATQTTKKEDFLIDPSTTHTTKKKDPSGVGATPPAPTMNRPSAMELELELARVPEWLAPFCTDVSTLPGAKNYHAGQENKLSRLSAGERHELSTSLQRHLSNTYQKNGFTATQDPYERYEASRSETVDKKMHHDFIESISADSQLLALIKKVGIRFS